jgi:hypothetical protein
MSRLTYATVVDVARRFDPRLDQASLLSGELLEGDANDVETIQSRLDGIESKWDRQATPMRAIPIGSRTAPKVFDAKGSPWPVTIYLDHQNVAPLDPSMGDFIETRAGRDNYTDITAQRGSAWTADWDMGTITVHRYPGAGQLPAFHRIRDKFVRISYHVAAGGDRFRAGETTLTESLGESADGEVSVTQASRLPRGGGVMLVGGGSIPGGEYVDVASVDHDADTVEIADRGLRGTSNVAHDSGGSIHYCPMDVREAVAAKAAVELALTEDFTEWLFDGDVDRQTRMDTWDSEWSNTVASYSDQAGYE